jgi:hypothetical protein
VVRERLEEVIAQVPAHRETIGDHPHELPLASQVLEEHHQLQFEEDDRVDGGPTSIRVERTHQIPHEREIEPSFQAAVEVVLWDQVFEREVLG